MILLIHLKKNGELIGFTPCTSLAELASKCDTLTVKAADIAGELGNGKAMNIVLLGALVKAMNVSGIDWKEVITKNVKKGFEELNIKAFEAGYSL